MVPDVASIVLGPELSVSEFGRRSPSSNATTATWSHPPLRSSSVATTTSLRPGIVSMSAATTPSPVARRSVTEKLARSTSMIAVAPRSATNAVEPSLVSAIWPGSLPTSTCRPTAPLLGCSSTSSLPSDGFVDGTVTRTRSRTVSWATSLTARAIVAVCQLAIGVASPPPVTSPPPASGQLQVH